MGYVIEGLVLLTRDKRLWRYIAKPLMISALVFFVLVVLGYLLFVPILSRVLSGAFHVDPTVSGTILTLIYIVIWVFLSSVVYLGMAGFFSSLLWERLSIEVEQMVGGPGPKTTLPGSALTADGMVRFMVLMVVIVIATCTGGWLGPILGGLLSLFDFSAPYMLRRNLTFGKQWAHVFKLKGWLGFAVVGGVITLIPLVNVLMLPVMVAAGTIMCHRSAVEGRLKI